MTFKKFLEKINVGNGKIEQSQWKYGLCYGCGERAPLKRLITVVEKNKKKEERCCNRACIKKYLYPSYRQILGLEHLGYNDSKTNNRKHRKAGYHKPSYHVSLECPTTF